MRQRLVILRREDGTTLVELLAAILIGTILLMAAFQLMDLGTRSQAETADRLDTTARGRSAMELITQRLRSAVCGEDGSAAYLVTQPDKVVFRSSLGPSTEAVTLRPDLREIEHTGGRLVERRFAPTNTIGLPTYGGYPDAPNATTTLASDVKPLGTAPGVFTYLDGADAAMTPPTDPAVALTPLKVKVALEFSPRRAKAALATKFESVVMTNLDDPTDTDQLPEC